MRDLPGRRARGRRRGEATEGEGVIGQRWKLTALVCLLALAVTAPGARAHTDAKRPGWISPFAWAVAVCETGKGHNHPDFRHDSGSYEGAWGWFAGTWKLDRRRGYPKHAYQATSRQQNRVFHDSIEKGRYFGCHRNGGYRSWLR